MKFKRIVITTLMVTCLMLSISVTAHASASAGSSTSGGSQVGGGYESIDIKADGLAVRSRGEINDGDMDKDYVDPFPTPKRTKAIQSAEVCGPPLRWDRYDISK